MSDPTTALHNLLQPGNLAQHTFPPASRYHGVPLAEYTQDDGTVVAYVRRRFIPPLESYAPIGEHTMTAGERLDTLAAQALGDPELFWRLCDANGVLWPQELEQPGSTVQITLPAGMASNEPQL